MLTTLNHFIIKIFGDGFQKNFLHHLPRHQGEAHQSVVPWILLAFLEDKIDICFVVALGNLL